ncbi:glutamate--cysteine ligase [Allokutzneria sp. A3M-2-11 16]|uniref:carboxylate-amine ligase n=1 Tax=Allokutzneria sp. A3M-2-11 16 TaxID=2962043 RepID=UPI0020B8A792|nr:glutamate--cysteine ligase [Allokutzneria sp. A3M-2-11 16]MCP3801465.1 glutamate--cysteine ligase [Allokutzneria sp. A3M-2-11 16]
MEPLTVGVEEEFLLVDAETRQLSWQGPALLRAAPDTEGDLQTELTRCQVESATPVCTTATEVLENLRTLRGTLADQARSRGLRLIASGTAPLHESAPPQLTANPRYRRISEHAGALALSSPCCGCHIHVGVPSPEVGVQVINHLRPWLPVLLALSVNSPFSDGDDTGYHSWRSLSWSQWPSSGPPPYSASHAAYEESVRELLASGAALDRGMIYWDVRLSDEWPTVELRVCDVAPTAEEATLLAVLARALVTRAVNSDGPAPLLSHHALRAALWRAARDGISGQGYDVHTGRLAPMWALVERLVEWTVPVLEQYGDLAYVDSMLGHLGRVGSGAARQRSALAEGGFTGLVDMLSKQTEPDA